MRLTPKQQRIIRETAAEVFGSGAMISVFGSRLDDSARGGDLDLLVRSEQPIQDRQRKTLQFVAKLQIRLGDQPIDVLVLDPQTDRKPIHEQAIRTGERL